MNIRGTATISCERFVYKYPQFMCLLLFSSSVHRFPVNEVFYIWNITLVRSWYIGILLAVESWRTQISWVHHTRYGTVIASQARTALRFVPQTYMQTNQMNMGYKSKLYQQCLWQVKITGSNQNNFVDGYRQRWFVNEEENLSNAY